MSYSVLLVLKAHRTIFLRGPTKTKNNHLGEFSGLSEPRLGDYKKSERRARPPSMNRESLYNNVNYGEGMVGNG